MKIDKMIYRSPTEILKVILDDEEEATHGFRGSLSVDLGRHMGGVEAYMGKQKDVEEGIPMFLFSIGDKKYTLSSENRNHHDCTECPLYSTTYGGCVFDNKLCGSLHNWISLNEMGRYIKEVK